MPKQGRLAAPAPAHYGKYAAALHGKIYPVQDHSAIETFYKVLNFYQRFCHAGQNPFFFAYRKR
jgi:hypothetical protein